MSPSFVKPPSHRPAKPPAGSYEASASAFESYQYEEEESKVHIDLRETSRDPHMSLTAHHPPQVHIDLRETMRQDKRWARHYWTLLVMNLIIVVAIGVGTRCFSVHTRPPLPPRTSHIPLPKASA